MHIFILPQGICVAMKICAVCTNSIRRYNNSLSSMYDHQNGDPATLLHTGQKETQFNTKWIVGDLACFPVKKKKKYFAVPGPLVSPAVAVCGLCKLTSDLDPHTC